VGKRLSVEEANAELLALQSQPYGGFELLKSLPEGVDADLASTVAVRWFSDSIWKFARVNRNTPLSVARAIRAKLDALDDANAIIVRELVDPAATDEAFAAQWKEALQVLLDLDCSYEWGSTKNKAKLRGLATTPRVLAALQAAAASGKHASLRVLGALALDGSETSCDALLPHFAGAANTGSGELDRLALLQKHAADTPAMRALLGQVKARLATREALSPALALAASLGLDVQTFWFDVGLHSFEPDETRVSRFQGGARVDSRSPRWFDVWMGEVNTSSLASRHTRFVGTQGGADGFGLGTCSAGDLPKWIASAAQLLGITWRSLEPRTNLRGKKKEALHAWLRGD
jgi:hypothetical protein